MPILNWVGLRERLGSVEIWQSPPLNAGWFESRFSGEHDAIAQPLAQISVRNAQVRDALVSLDHRCCV